MIIYISLLLGAILVALMIVSLCRAIALWRGFSEQTALSSARQKRIPSRYLQGNTAARAAFAVHRGRIKSNHRDQPGKPWGW